jgi:hypothetical protein
MRICFSSKRRYFTDLRVVVRETGRSSYGLDDQCERRSSSRGPPLGPSVIGST